MAQTSSADTREGLLRAVRTLAVGQIIYATPSSTWLPVRGQVVETDHLALALKTATNEIVWVHGEDCPDLVKLISS